MVAMQWFYASKNSPKASLKSTQLPNNLSPYRKIADELATIEAYNKPSHVIQIVWNLEYSLLWLTSKLAELDNELQNNNYFCIIEVRAMVGHSAIFIMCIV